MPLEKSAGALIFNSHITIRRKKGKAFTQSSKPHREYLLLRYEAGHWDFPKGHLEGNESPERAARMEVMEETGLTVHNFIPGFKQQMRYWLWPYRSKGEERPRRSLKIVTFFLVETATRQVRLSDEHTGYAWLPYTEAVKLATYSNAKLLIRNAEAFLRTKEVKDEKARSRKI